MSIYVDTIKFEDVANKINFEEFYLLQPKQIDIEAQNKIIRRYG